MHFDAIPQPERRREPACSVPGLPVAPAVPDTVVGGPDAVRFLWAIVTQSGGRMRVSRAGLTEPVGHLVWTEQADGWFSLTAVPAGVVKP